MKFPETKYDIDQEVVNKLNRDIHGFIVGISFNAPTYWTYLVQWETGAVSPHKEVELLSETESYL